MIKSPRFNYIVTIHNTADILERTLAGIAACATRESLIFPVLDGCTDRSEAIVDAFAASSGLNVHKLHMPDAHMLRSANAALRLITGGFTIVIQDDVILDDPQLERKIAGVYAEYGARLGVLSFRLAANVRRTPWLRQMRARSAAPMIEECNFIQSPDDHQAAAPRALYGSFHERMVAINGPNCIPETVRRAAGILDEHMAPFGYDDDDYCLRAMQAGFINGLFPVRFRSDLEWGGTRKDPAFKKRAAIIHKRNRRYVWRKHGEFITKLWKSGRINPGNAG